MKRLIGVFILLTFTFPFMFFIQPIAVAYPSQYWINSSFHDELSGKDFYLFYTSNIYNRKIIVHDPIKDQWNRIEGNYLWFSGGYHDLFPTISKDVIDQYYYDTVNNKIVEGNQYLKSDNGKWGYLIETTYDNGKREHVFLKNFVNGDIFLLYETNNSYRIFWTRDNQLLINRYSETAKQNEIVLYSPENREYHEVTLGTIRRFSPEQHLILYVKNEPRRLEWLYDLSTNQERLAGDEDENHQWFSHYSYKQPPMPPEDLDIDNLEVIKPTFEVDNEHKLIFNDQEIPVFYTFTKEGKTFIPVRSLMKPFNIRVTFNQNENDLISYENSLQLNDENSVIFHNRLFVTPEVLEFIGIPSFTIQSNQEIIR